MPVEARAYPRPLPNPEWLGKLTEETLEPDLPIVDPRAVTPVGFSYATLSISSAHSTEPQLAPFATSQMRRQGHPRQQRFAGRFDRVRSLISRRRRALAKLCGDDLAYFRKSERCFKTELKNLAERSRVVPDSRQHRISHIRGGVPDSAFDQLGNVVAVEHYFCCGLWLHLMTG